MSSSGSPRIVVITVCGSGAAKPRTNSTSPSSIQLSMRACAARSAIAWWRCAPSGPTHGSVTARR